MTKLRACALAALLSTAGPAAVALAQPAPAPGPALAGDWSGTLPALPPKQIVIHVRPAEGTVQVTMDVPALGVQGVPIRDFGRSGQTVRFAIPEAGVKFEGEVQDGGREIRGVFTDHDITEPLVLAHAASTAAPPPLKVATAVADWQVPSADAVRQILKAEIAHRQAMGLIVGVVGPGGRMIVSEGDAGDGRPMGADTPLYVESVAKALTGLLLADMAERGEVKLDDPVDLYLPQGVHMPTHGGRKITLMDLATHTSGLPRGEDRVAFEELEHYGVDRMHRFLAGYPLSRDPGAAYQYSDIGFALLGDALARREGTSFEQLLTSRILKPLGLKSTTTRAEATLVQRMPTLYDSGLRPQGKGPALDPAWIPAEVLYSDVDDMLRLLETQLGYRDNPLAAASTRARTVRRPIAPAAGASLAWEVRTLGPGVEVFGVTGGSRSMMTYVAFRPDTKVGVVVYANASTALNPTDIALHVLSGRPVPPPSPPIATVAETAITLPAGILARYVGRYRLTPQMTLNVTAEGERLFGAVNDNPLTELYPSSPTHFFARTANAQVDFQPGPDGRASGLTLKLNGVDMTATRTGD